MIQLQLTKIQIWQCGRSLVNRHTSLVGKIHLSQLASWLIYARALVEYVIIIMWLRSVIEMLRCVKFAEDKVAVNEMCTG